MNIFLLCKNISKPMLLPMSTFFDANHGDHRRNRVTHRVVSKETPSRGEECREIPSSHRYRLPLSISIPHRHLPLLCSRTRIIDRTLLHISSAPDAAVVVCRCKVPIAIAKAIDQFVFPLEPEQTLEDFEQMRPLGVNAFAFLDFSFY